MSFKYETFRKTLQSKLDIVIQDQNMSSQIEHSIFDACTKDAEMLSIVPSMTNESFRILYTNKLRSVWMNLQDNSDTGLFAKLKKGVIDPANVGFVTHQEMNNEIWKELINNKIERDNHKYNNDDKQGASQEFRCGRCKKRETKYCQVQTRSADEPMTTFVTCINCGNHWKC